MFPEFHKPVVLSPKRILVFLIIGILIPGMGEIYLGDPYKKAGLARLGSFILSFPLIFAFGLGLFLIAFIWISNFISVILTVIRSVGQQETEKNS